MNPGERANVDGIKTGTSTSFAAPATSTAPLQLAVSWPPSTHIIYNNRGYLPIKAQSEGVRALLHNAIIRFKGDALFVHAFPEIRDRIKYTRDTLYNCAKELKLSDIKIRLKEDKLYAGALAALVSVFELPSSVKSKLI